MKPTIWTRQIPGKCSWIQKKVLKSRAIIEQIGGWQQIEQKGKMSIIKLYQLLRPQTPKSDWRKIICNSKASPKSVFIVWLARNRLATKDRLVHWGVGRDTTCKLCDTCNETVQHMFFDCYIGAEVWGKVMEVLQIRQHKVHFQECMQWVTACSQKSSTRAQVINMCYAETVHNLWLHRNNKIFGNMNKPINVPVGYRKLAYWTYFLLHMSWLYFQAQIIASKANCIQDSKRLKCYNM